MSSIVCFPALNSLWTRDSLHLRWSRSKWNYNTKNNYTNKNFMLTLLGDNSTISAEVNKFSFRYDPLFLFSTVLFSVSNWNVVVVVPIGPWTSSFRTKNEQLRTFEIVCLLAHTRTYVMGEEKSVPNYTWQCRIHTSGIAEKISHVCHCTCERPKASFSLRKFNSVELEKWGQAGDLSIEIIV